MRGLLFHDADLAAAITADAFANGLIIERCGPLDEVIKFLAPLTIGYAELDEGLDILDRSMERVIESQSKLVTLSRAAE
jgi:diaminobutyrate-2-oxoglutarate transaminase